MMKETQDEKEKKIKAHIAADKKQYMCTSNTDCTHKSIVTGHCLHAGPCNFKQVPGGIDKVRVKEQLMAAFEKAVDELLREL
jgi:hypothetical protein